MTAETAPGMQKRHHWGDTVLKGSLWSAAAVVLITLAAILVILFLAGRLAFDKFGVGFLWLNQWDPGRDLFGALPAVVGTLATSVIAIALAWPVGFGVAYFLTETCPRFLRGPLGVAIELLAAVPSIVYGMWGAYVLAPVVSSHIAPWLTQALGFIPQTGGFLWFNAPSYGGVGLLTAGIVLAIMILPLIAAATRDVLQTTPQLLKDGGYAMGATKWETLTGVVIPAVRGSLFGAVFLALGRALGETMAVTFVIGNANRLPDSLYAPASSIASVIANEFPDAEQGSLKMGALFALGFILFVISFVVLAVARLLLRQGRMA